MSHFAPFIMTFLFVNVGICPSTLVVCPEINSAINLVNCPIYLYLTCPTVRLSSHWVWRCADARRLSSSGDSHGINMRGRTETPTLAVCRLTFGVGLRRVSSSSTFGSGRVCGDSCHQSHWQPLWRDHGGPTGNEGQTMRFCAVGM